MTSQYIRHFSLKAEGSETIDLSELRCRFEIHPRPGLVPRACNVKITNLKESLATKFVGQGREFTKITIEAGYEDHYAIVFKGNIVWGRYGKENPTDTVTEIWANDGDMGNNYATVNTTHKPGSTQADHLDTALQAMKQYGITKGFIGIDLSQLKYPRAVTLYGMARDVIRSIAQSNSAVAYYENEKLNIVSAKGNVSGGIIKLNSTSGLIDKPVQTEEGIFARCLINPDIALMKMVQIDQKDIIQGSPTFDQIGNPIENVLADIATDGIYTVFKIDIVGDTRGQPWYYDLAMHAKGKVPLKSGLYTQFGDPSAT